MIRIEANLQHYTNEQVREGKPSMLLRESKWHYEGQVLNGNELQASHSLGASPIVLNKCTRKDILEAARTSPRMKWKYTWACIALFYDSWIVFMVIHSSFHARRIYELMGIAHMYMFTDGLHNCFKSIELWMYMDVHIAQDWEMLMSLYR
jgi:hypothetical protein